jgi:hypothetical protein
VSDCDCASQTTAAPKASAKTAIRRTGLFGLFIFLSDPGVSIGPVCNEIRLFDPMRFATMVSRSVSSAGEVRGTGAAASPVCKDGEAVLFCGEASGEISFITINLAKRSFYKR